MIKRKLMLKDSPILVYNACCAFCRDVANWLLEHFGDKEKLKIVPNTSAIAASLHPDLNEDNVKENVHLIYEGRLFSAGGAVANVLALKKSLRWIKYIYKIPILKQFIDFSYIIVKKTKGLYNRIKGE